MRDYSPKRRTAVVLAGTGLAGAYHAGALKALDESGVKVDLVVGTGAGAVSAAFAAVAAGPSLYGEGGFWDGLRWDGLFRLRPLVRISLLLLGCSLGVLAVPLILALLAGVLFPLVLVADLAFPGAPARALALLWAPDALRAPYLAALAVPIAALAAVMAFAGLGAWLRDRRRFAERFEWLLDDAPARARVMQHLGEAVRGAATAELPGTGDLGPRFVAVAAENLGQPGFRELIVRATDLETGGPIAFTLLSDPHQAAHATARRGAGVVALRSQPKALLEAVLASLLPPLAAPVQRLVFPRGGGLHAGETHRLADGTLSGGCGIADALAAGAEQVVVVCPTPEEARALPRRRGPRALADALLATFERRGLEQELSETERINRMVATLGHAAENGVRAWEDPATGRLYKEVALWLVRPDQRRLGPLEFDGAQDPATEVLEEPWDLVDQGHQDAYRQFVEPVVGAAPPEPRKTDERHHPEPAGIQL
jgi:predicted acylesterase/phospholipase RssA